MIKAFCLDMLFGYGDYMLNILNLVRRALPRFVEVDDVQKNEEGEHGEYGEYAEYDEVDVEHIVTYAVEQDLDVEDLADDLAALYECQTDLNHPSLDSDTPKSALSQF